MKMPEMISGQGVMAGLDVQATAATQTRVVSAMLQHASEQPMTGVHTPKQPNRQRGATHDHGNKALLGNHVTLLFELALDARQCRPCDDQAAEHDPDKDAEEGQRAHACIVSPLHLKSDGISREEQVYWQIWMT